MKKKLAKKPWKYVCPYCNKEPESPVKGCLNPTCVETRSKRFQKRKQREAGFNSSLQDYNGDYKGVCKSCHHVMGGHDGEYWHKRVDKDGKPYRCEYVKQGKVKFKFGDPEVLPFLRKKDRRSNKRAEGF